MTRSRVCLAVASLLWLGTVALYLPVRHDDFIPGDDRVYVAENPFLADGLGPAGLARSFTRFELGNWHPLTTVSYAVDHAVRGLEPGAYAITNALLHATAAALLFLALVRLSGSVGASAFVAAIFAVHPTHVESVAWISERKDVLSAVFFAAVLYAYFRQSQDPRRLGPRVTVAVLLLLGLLSKAMLVTTPFVLLLLDYWPLGRLRAGPRAGSVAAWKPLVVEKLPLFALAAAFSIVAVAAQRSAGALASSLSLPLSDRLANVSVSYLEYLRLSFWPLDLAYFYPFARGGTSGVAVLLSIGALALLTAGALAVRRERPYLLVGWLWFLGMLVPVCGLVQIGAQRIADRYLYLPGIGLSLAVGFAARDVAGTHRAGRAAAATAGLLVVGSLAFLTERQIATWRDGETLARQALRVTSDNARAHALLASALLRQGRAAEARPEIEQAIALEPDLALHYGMQGSILEALGERERAVVAYRRALALDDGLTAARLNLGMLLVELGKPQDASPLLARAATESSGADAARAHLGLGRAHALEGDLNSARSEYEEALALDPESGPAHEGLGIALLQEGRLAEATRELERGAALASSDPVAQAALGDALARQGRTAEAIEAFRAALRLRPEWPELANNLAVLLVTASDPSLRRPDEAVRWAEAAARATERRNPSVLATLATAYAAANRPADALATAREAEPLARAKGDVALAAALRERSARYAAAAKAQGASAR